MTSFGAAETHLVFLSELRQIVPPDCRPVIVADGGFLSTFFRAWEAVGMAFVISLRNQKFVAMFERSASLAPHQAQQDPSADAVQLPNMVGA